MYRAQFTRDALGRVTQKIETIQGDGLSLYDPQQAGVSIAATTESSLPEPGSVPLLWAAATAWLAAGFLARRR